MGVPREATFLVVRRGGTRRGDGMLRRPPTGQASTGHTGRTRANGPAWPWPISRLLVLGKHARKLYMQSSVPHAKAQRPEETRRPQPPPLPSPRCVCWQRHSQRSGSTASVQTSGLPSPTTTDRGGARRCRSTCGHAVPAPHCRAAGLHRPEPPPRRCARRRPWGR